MNELRSLRNVARGSAAAVLAAATALMAPAAATAAPCPNVEIVFARGTNEAPGIGRVGQALADNLRPLLGGRTLSTYAVNYPATLDFLGTSNGAADATARIVAMSQQCPATQIVLGGYSQGASIIDMLVGIPPLGNKVGDVGSAPPLPGSVSGNVAAVTAFGNPSTKFGIPVSAAGGVYGGRGIDLCNDGDPICSDGRNPFAHSNYERTPMPAQAAAFVAGLV